MLVCFRQGMTRRGIARDFGISRDSVDEMIVYASPPGYRRTAPIERPKLDRFTEIIDAARGVPKCSTVLQISPCDVP